MIKNISTLFVFLSILTITSCSSERRNPVPEQHTSSAEVEGFENARANGYGQDLFFQKDLEQSLVTYTSKQKTNPKKIDILALSGGGSDGAFSAGILNGWSRSGKRPDFYMVTGISTGALIAPLAFLGEEYDNKLKEAFTSISQEDIYETQILSGLIGSSASLANTKPLENLIAKYFTEDVLIDIANAHKKGKRLYIGTTNIDNQRIYIWNIGEIATQPNKEKSLALIRKILLASSSIPVAFPPVKFKVKANNNYYDELHVDGGITSEVFLYGFYMDFSKAIEKLENPDEIDKSIYIIRNSKIFKDYSPVDQNFLSIGKKAVFGLTNSQGVGDLFRIYFLSQKDGFKYNFTYIPKSYKPVSKEAFNRDEMRNLYKFGFKVGESQCCWKHSLIKVD